MKTSAIRQIFTILLLLICTYPRVFATTAQLLPPAITSISPVSGSVGTLVTITGTDLSNPTAFSIGGVPAIVISNTGTSLVGMVMPGAATGVVSVSTDNGTVNSAETFTVTSTGYPNVQQGNKLVGTGAIGTSRQGYSISLSADGNTAIVGGEGDDGGNGAIWVFTRSNGVWSQQGDKLVGTGATGGAGQGGSVSLSADGNTAIVGGVGDNLGKGAAWVFIRYNGVWNQQGDKLIGVDATSEDVTSLGVSVSLSADGNTAIVGGGGDDSGKGAAWIFTRSNGVWSQQGTKLVGSGATGFAQQGTAVSISADGNTVVVGGPLDDGNIGAAWVFTRSNGFWSQQGNKLVGTGAINSSSTGNAVQGSSVSLSADGNTAIVGGNGDDENKGAVWVYIRSNGIWSQQGTKLVGSGAIGSAFQGGSVSLSADGNTAIVGGGGDDGNKGAAWVYRRSNGFWSQQGAKLIGANVTGYQIIYNNSVSIAADGSTAMLGTPGDDEMNGASFIFTSGLTSSNNTITYDGNGNTSGTVPVSQTASTGSSVTLTGNTGNLAKTEYSFAGWNTAADGSGTNYAAGTDYTLASSFTLYARWELPLPTISSISPVSGGVGTLVTISGTDLSNPTAFSIGGVPAIVISNTGTSLVGMVMPGATTDVVSVTTENGTVNSAETFTVTPTGYPNAQQGSKLVGTGASSPFQAYQGTSVALSADGNTAIVGGYYDNTGNGAAWVYTRSNGVWSQQGNKLIGTGVIGSATQGRAVSISADGNTAIVGGYFDDNEKGAAWVFTRSNGVWSQQGGKLVGTGAIGKSFQGIAVSITADGNTVIVGGSEDDGKKGAAWVFTRTKGIWSQQGNKLIGTGAVGSSLQGIAVSISADGSTVIVGGNIDDSSKGAAWVYTRSNGVWSQQGNKLVGTGATAYSYLGRSVSISADGNTAIIGGNGDDGQKGAIWVFTRSNGIWSQQGNKLVGTGAVGNAWQGNSVSVSADGNLVIVGGNGDDNFNGAAWVYTRLNGVWSQQGNKLVGTGAVGNAWQGNSVSVSADGNTAIIGGDRDEILRTGAAWIFTTGISYDGNGNTSGTAPESQTPSNGSAVTLSANTGSLAKTGFAFRGWNTAADGSGTSYVEGHAYTFTGSVTLFAKWQSCNDTYFDTTIRLKPNELPLSWNGNTIGAAGIYRDTLQNSTGCDSIVSLHLQVLPEFEYTTPASFMVNVTIQPLGPISSGSAIRGYYGKVATVAGQSQSGFVDGNNNLALFNTPSGVVTDSAGNIYVSDRNNNAIRKIDHTGTVSSFAGAFPGNNNSFGFTDGLGTSARFNAPEGLALDKEGNIYVADQANHAIRKISPDGLVTTIAGTGNSGQIDGAVDSATFNLPSAVAVDSKGNIYVADTYNNKIRKISADGLVSTIAGNGSIGNQDGPGTEATFSNPAGIYVDVFDNIYVTEELNHQIRKIDKYGIVSTIAGNSQPGFAEGIGAEVQFFYPRGIIGDEAGNLLIADLENNIIRKLGSDNYVSIFAGNGIASSENSDMLTSTFNKPVALAVDTINKKILVTEQMGHNVRSIQYSGFSIFPDLPEGLSLDSMGNITGTATQVSPLTNYMVIGTNAFGADTAFVDLEITASDSFAVTLLDKTDVNGCSGDSTGAINIQITGNQGSVTFEWTSPENPSFNSAQQQLSNLKAGIYHLVARDSTGNVDSIDVELFQPDALVLEGFADNAYCNGDSSGYLGISYGGGTPKEGDISYDVLWNFGGTADVYYNAAPGVYSVTVTDANGCSAEVNDLIVDEPPVISLTFNVTDVLCNGDSTGTLKVIASGGTVSSSGSSAYSYLWGNGNTDFSLTGLKVGVYAVTVKDDFLCSVSGSFEVKQPQALSIIIQPKAVSCFGGADGSVLINVSGGMQSYMYKVDSSNFISANSFSGLTKGLHQATVRDSNNCIKQIDFQILEPLQLAVIPGVITGSCTGGGTGIINITVTGGTGNKRFNWTGPNGYTSNREDLTGLQPGNYTVQVLDTNNCSVTRNITVPVLSAITIAGSVVDVACFGGATGSITLSSPTVQLGLTYTWTGPNGFTSTTRNPVRLRAGTYQVAIRQGTCVYTNSFVVAQPAQALAAVVSKVDITRCSGTGTINISASGGTPPYAYSLNNAAFQLNSTYTVASTGTYSIITRDSKGCTVTSSVSVIDTGSDPYEPNATQATAFAYTLNSGAINARIAPTANDVDWFRFTAKNTPGLTHTVSITHPSIRYTFDLLDARGRVIGPTTNVRGVVSTKTYRSLTPGAIYSIRIRGSLSLVCYQLNITDGTGIALQSNPLKNDISTSFVHQLIAAASKETLQATAFPNPHAGRFTLKIDAPYKGVANVMLLTTGGQKIESKSVMLKKGENQVVFTPNSRQATLVYRVELGQLTTSGIIVQIK